MIELPIGVSVGGGLCFPHGGPVTINPNSVLGNNIMIHPCVLIGGMRGKGVPKIGNGVFIGHGSKIIGDITIGDDCFIAPGSVVIQSVENGKSIGGNPAKVLNNNGRKNCELYIKK